MSITSQVNHYWQEYHSLNPLELLSAFNFPKDDAKQLTDICMQTIEGFAPGVITFVPL